MARFEDVQADFWKPDSSYGVHQPLTDEAVRNAERLLGVTLPTSLLDLLRAQNGGESAAERNAFPTDQPTSWSADHVPFDHLMGIGDHEHTVSVLDSPYLIEEWGTSRACRAPLWRRALLDCARLPGIRPTRGTIGDVVRR
ncbi:SMI1/KNR4 family protein [Streptomyces sp. NPDC049097]|uniref:SMI1/KNR4 family protein n=1 Tax=Streptomyces sp. NPDC049097 TaxID=3155497 RepID=UPI0034195C6B